MNIFFINGSGVNGIMHVERKFPFNVGLTFDLEKVFGCKMWVEILLIAMQQNICNHPWMNIYVILSERSKFTSSSQDIQILWSFRGA